LCDGTSTSRQIVGTDNAHVTADCDVPVFFDSDDVTCWRRAAQLHLTNGEWRRRTGPKLVQFAPFVRFNPSDGNRITMSTFAARRRHAVRGRGQPPTGAANCQNSSTSHESLHCVVLPFSRHAVLQQCSCLGSTTCANNSKNSCDL